MGRHVFDRTLTRWFLAGTLAVMGGSGCAAQSQAVQAQKKQVDELQSRIRELERTNGRLMTRIDEMEDDVFLLEDRVEAHRLALKRRGQMGRGRQRGIRIQAPRPTPQTSYGQNNYRGGHQISRPDNRYRSRGRETRPQRSRGHTVTTVPPTARSDRPQPESQSRAPSKSTTDTQGQKHTPDEQEESIVITAEDFREFAGGQSSSSSKSPSDSGTSREKTPKKRVTEEKLKTTEQLSQQGGPGTRSNPSHSGSTAPDGAEVGRLEGKTGLDLYKASLSLYRSGDYAAALNGFQSFMDASPRRDYQDNGLYWIGECYFGLGRHERSIDYFERVINEQPDGNKVPDAMLKMALAYKELDNPQKTRSLLQTLTDRYPTTNAGRLGAKKLSDLNS